MVLGNIYYIQHYAI